MIYIVELSGKKIRKFDKVRRVASHKVFFDTHGTLWAAEASDCHQAISVDR